MPMMDIGQLNNINRFQFIEQFKITALTTGAVIFSVVIFEMCLTL